MKLHILHFSPASLTYKLFFHLFICSCFVFVFTHYIALPSSLFSGFLYFVFNLFISTVLLGIL